jgi:hypothetical protein
VVRRIFAEVLAGRSVLAIVRGLNADGIPPPGGGGGVAAVGGVARAEQPGARRVAATRVG